MVSDTRSARKSKEDLDGSKQKGNSLLRSPGNTGKALSAQRTESSPNARKSKRLEKEMPPITPPSVKRTSKRVGKCNTPNSLRRSDRGKKESSSGSFSKESKHQSKLKRKKEKTVIQVTMESKKAEVGPEQVGMKRKNLNARKFSSLFKRQRIRKIMPDGDSELERSENSIDVCSGSSRVNNFQLQPMEDSEDVGDDCSKRVVEGALLDSSLRDCHAGVDNDIRDYAVDDPCSKYPTYCSSTENKSYSEASLDGSTHGIVTEDAASASRVCENCNLEGTCLLCSKIKRVRYDSPEQELCSCCIPMADDLVGFSTRKERSDLGVAAQEFDSGHPMIERHADFPMDGTENLCGLCFGEGDLLYCEGKSCTNCYHLSCLEPPLTDALPGVWHCPQCVKKKLLFGMHSVADGVESIWDVREVVIPNAEGVQQRQFLVKYRGLAHVHNHWVPEKQLLLENPRLVSTFLDKEQDVRWNTEWLVPHRLLGKRPLKDSIYVASASIIWVCEYEWLVKWRGLDYDHATWELDNANFLRSSLGQDLMMNYEIRRGGPKKEANKPYTESIVRHSVIPGQSSETHVLKNVNKLREFLLKCPNAVVFDDQDRTTPAILLINSLIETFRSFLVVTTYDSLSRWEADFEQLVPSVDVVVYSGSRDTRNMIRNSEFYDGGGHMIVQVLLSPIEAVLEDLEILKSIKWKCIIVDEYQYAKIANGLEQIMMLPMDMRILLVNGQIKDATYEYLKILSFVVPHRDFDKLRSLSFETNDNLSKLKDRLSCFTAYGQSSQVSKFIEYWVPVQMSNLQLELYCFTLLSNSNALCTCSKKDSSGLLPEILLTVRKCCHHPYLVDPSIQARLIAEKDPAKTAVDVGIQASGKLQLLDLMLTEIKTRGLQVLIIFQLISSDKVSTVNILHDFLFQRFGIDTFERVDALDPPSERQAAVNRFKEKKTGQFVFLLENRACSTHIKLSSLDVVVIYDSDWNPANDLKALKKISFDSQVERIKVFRLYSSFTIEERALMLAKQNSNLDHSSHHFSRSTNNSLLSWGVRYLFNKLDEYHADRNSSLALNSSSGQSILDQVTKEFQAILSGKFENAASDSIISEAKSDVGSYSANTRMFGESKVMLNDEKAPNVFWKALFEGKNPVWKHLTGPSPRNRKKIHYWEGSPSNSETGKDNMAKKRKKMVHGSFNPGSCEVELGALEATQVTVPNEGPSIIKSCNQSEDLHRDGQSSLVSGASVSAASKERIVSSGEQQRTHGVLQREMKILCQNLKLPDNVIQVAENFLEYVIRNCHVNSNSTSIEQAFQISLCWVAASIAKQKIDKKESLMMAKQFLGYQCTEEEASSVYLKMRPLKKIYLQCSDNISCFSRDFLLSEDDFSRRPSNVNTGILQYAQENANHDIGENSSDKELPERQVLTQQKVTLQEKDGASEIDDDEIKRMQKKFEKREKKLLQKYKDQIHELLRIWETKKAKLENDHRLKLALIRSIHGQTSGGMDKLKLLDDNFKNKIRDHDLLKDAELKNLEAEHSAVISEERQKVADWLAKAKSCSSKLNVINGCQSFSSQRCDGVGGHQPSPSIADDVGDEDDFLMSRQHLENKSPNQSFSRQGNDVIPSISSRSTPDDAICHETTTLENLVTVNPENEVEVETCAVAELLNQPKNSVDNRQSVLTKPPTPVEQVEIQSVDQSEELPVVPETVHNEIVGGAQAGLLSCPLEVEPNDTSLLTEQTPVLPDCWDTLPNVLKDIRKTTEGEMVLGGQSRSDKHLGSAELQDSDPLGEENECAPLIEPTSSVTPVPPNIESPITDNIATPGLSNEAPVDEVFGQLHSLSVDISLSCSQVPASEDHNQGRSSPRTAVPEGTEAVSHESISQTEENLELHPNCLNALVNKNIAELTVNELERPNHTVPRSDLAILQEMVNAPELPNPTILQNHVATPQDVASTSGQPNQAVPQVADIEASNLHERGFLLNPNHQPTSCNYAPSLLPNPLQSEIERMHKENEQLEKIHADKMAQLKSDCDKEIEETISQIRNRYEVKSREAEAEYRLKSNEHDKNLEKVLLNKILADALRSKFDPKPPGLRTMQQGTPNFALPHFVRPFFGPASQPAGNQITATPHTRNQFNTTPPASRPTCSPLTTTPTASQRVRTQLNTTLPASQPVLTRFNTSLPTSHPARTQFTSTPRASKPDRTQLTTTLPASQPARTHFSTTPPALQPTRTQHMATPLVQQLSQSHSVRSSPASIRNVTAHPIQGLQRGEALVSINSARPPVINAITPASLRASGNIRSGAPHLQPFRPAVGAPITPDASSPVPPRPPPQMLHKPLQLPSQLGPRPQTQRPALPDLVDQNSAEIEGGKSDFSHPPGFPALPDLVDQNSAEIEGGKSDFSHPPGFRQGLVGNHQPYLPVNRNLTVPDIPSTFHALEQSDLEMLGNAVGDTSAVKSDLVCLSDDE